MTTPHSYPEQLLSQTAWLERLARALVPGDSAADLAQETLAAALARPKPHSASVRTWLERIARNLAAGGTRARHRRLRREQDKAQADPMPSTVETVAQFEMHRSVVDAVQNLRDPIRTTLLLRFWEDLPPREIAKRMKAPVETVRTRIKRGLQQLRTGLDAQHGRREVWSLPLLSLTTQHAVAVPTASLVVAVLGVLMQAKTLLFTAGAIALALITMFVWDGDPAKQPDNLPTPNGVTAEVASSEDSAFSPGEATSAQEIDSPSRTSVGRDPVAASEWFEGSVVDDQSRPLANVEVAFLTTSEADRYSHRGGTTLSAKALQIRRVRGMLWHITDRDLMKKAALLGSVLETELVTRTDLHGAFRFPRDAVTDQSVVAIWSPVIGFRFHPVTSLQAPARVLCERWPRLRGVITIDGNDKKHVKVQVDTDPSNRRDSKPVLWFVVEASGHYETPQIPPANHKFRFRAEDHSDLKKRVHVRSDATVDARLELLPLFDARLVDGAGLLLDGQRLEARGRQPGDLRFLLLREDHKNESGLAADNHPKSTLRYTRASGSLRGFVKDPEALVLSVWSGRERVAAVHLPDHLVAKVTMDIPPPKPPATLKVEVSLGGRTSPDSWVQLDLGMMVGLGHYNFNSAVTVEGAPGQIRLEVPGYLRGQTCHLRVTCGGFAEQLVKVSIPTEGSPELLRVHLPAAGKRVIGKVVDEDGRPLNDVRVQIANAAGRVFRGMRRSIGTTGVTGAFHFDDLPEGSYRVFVQHREFASSSALLVAGRKEPVLIRMDRGEQREVAIDAEGLAVQVRVLDVLGEPLLDDRVFGAMHGGPTTLMRLSKKAHKVEVWELDATEPLRTIELR